MSDVETGEAGDRDFTETTYQSYGGRMKNACCGVFMGIFLFFASMALLFWNEGRNIKRQRDLDEGQEIVVSTTVNDLTATVVSKLVHVTGPVTTQEVLQDPIFGVSTGTQNSTTALKLQRYVEMYQWQESSSSRTVKTPTGGERTETTYTYDKVWSPYLIDSDTFKDKDPLYENPESLPFDPMEWVADPILLGNVTLSAAVVNRFNWYESVSDVSVDDVLDAQVRQQVRTFNRDSGFYYSPTSGNASSSAAQVGDARITFAAVESDTVSIVALFTGDSLSSYTTSRGGTLLLVKRGTYTADELFLQAEEENTQLTWALRFVGFIIMVVSILIMLQPISTAVDIIPFIGDWMEGCLEGCVFPMIALLIALPMSAFVIALGWLWYRPVVAIPIVVVSLGIIIWLAYRAKMKKNEHDQQQQQQEQGTNASNYNKPTAQPYGGETNNYYSSQPPATSSNLPGFASALDNPPPSQMPVATAVPVAPSAPVENEVKVESDVFVPQTFKP